MFGKLYIYDHSSPEDRAQAEGRFSDDDDVLMVGVNSREDLLAQLNRLVAEKRYFSRLLIQTHGGPGNIKFDGKPIYDTSLKSNYIRGGFHRLFPLYTRVYFDGCNVAEGVSGDGFLETFGSIFLRGGGGEVFGWTSAGYGMSVSMFIPPFLWGHTVHFTGSLKKVYFRPGGVKFNPPAPKVVPIYYGPPPA